MSVDLTLKVLRVIGSKEGFIFTASLTFFVMLVIHSFVQIWNQEDIKFEFYIRDLSRKLNQDSRKVNQTFTVNTPKCQIPEYKIEDFGMVDQITYQNYIPCMNIPPLTEAIFDFNLRRYKLRIKIRSNYKCYFGEDSLNAKDFLNDEVLLKSNSESVIVKCFNDDQKEIYRILHILLPYKPELETRIQKWASVTKKPPSVLIFGIDTMSRLNFFRTMKSTAKTVLDDENTWFLLEGYNKVGQNTFPNLMAVLKGWDEHEISEVCNEKNNYLDDFCPLIWKDFEKNGYVTGYAEDFEEYSTFYFKKMGFRNRPTDYYFLPTFKGSNDRNTDNEKCIGYKYVPEMVYEYGIEFLERFKNTPYFGIFWTNEFSHNDVSEPTSMDSKVAEYIRYLISGDILNNTIVFLMSDHGIRFGTSRLTPKVGAQEDFMPLMLIRLPDWMKKERPDIVRALKANRNLLTSAFDTHMTLKYILGLSGDVNPSYRPQGCPLCQSLFKVVKERDCPMAGIPYMFCACENSYTICESEITSKVVQTVMDSLNYNISKHNKESETKCKVLDFDSEKPVNCSLRSDGYFKILFHILPEGVVESYVENGPNLSVETIQRLDSTKLSKLQMCSIERSLMDFCYC